MRKLGKILSVAAMSALGVLGFASCGGKKEDSVNTIKLVYSGTASNKDFNMQLIEDFKAYKKSLGDTNVYEITYVEHGPDKVDSEVVDWTAGPDVFEFASDKLAILYANSALAEIKGKYATYIDEEMNDFGKAAAKFNDKYFAYPYTGDNTYYLQYDKSKLTDDDVKTMEGLLAKAQLLGKKVGYNLPEGFYGGAAMFTFGADFNMTYDADGNISNVEADFNTEKGLLAAKAIYSIVNNSAWVKDVEVPSSSNDFVACVDGTWNIASYKTALGENYGCAPMPTVTVDGQTANLGAFLGGKLLGVNATKLKDDTTRLVAAHDLAMYLSGEDAQTKRFNEYQIAPCHKVAAEKDAVKQNLNVSVLAKQTVFAHPQTSVPSNFWSAPNTLISGMIDGTITESNLQEAIDTFNNSIKASK